AQSHQIDVISPIVAPKVAFPNPADGAAVPLPFAEIAVTFDQDMLAGDGTEAGSVLNLANYALTKALGGAIAIKSAAYDVATRTVRLSIDPLDFGDYTLGVGEHVKSIQGSELGTPFESDFTAISDLSALLSIEFGTVRSSRADGTVSYDVRITNISDADILAPLTLVLD
ncbi:Ig-like domain-containing protein, partial [Rhizobium ruizarguesonis]